MHDRGAIGVLAGLIAVLAGAVAAAVTIIAVKAARGSGDPGLYVGITDVSGTRDARGRPHVSVKYLLAVEGSRHESVVPETTVRCRVIEDGGGRTFEAAAGVFPAQGATRDGTLTVTPPESANDLAGPVRVRCDAARGDKTYFSATVPATVPGVHAPAGDAEQYEGVYQVTMRLVGGITLNCEAEVRHRTFTVTARGSSAITLELSGLGTESLGISSFDAALTKTAQFSGQVLLIPGESGWQGLLDGGFTRTAESIEVKGRFTRDDGHCTYEYTGRLAKPSDTGVFAITLEEIPGEDGCEPILAGASTKPGRIRFKVTNNTYGFAQIFIYDSEHNLTATNGTPIRERGGSALVTADLVAGTYDVQCDGPGSADKTVQLTVG